MANGNISELDNIYIMTKKILKAVANGRLNNSSDADDVVQDAFIVIAEKAAKFKDNNNAIGWILRIVDNLARDRSRKRKRHYDDSPDVESIEDPSDFEEKLIVKHIMESLNQYDRFLMYYKYWCGFTLSEIGYIIKKPKTTIASQIEKIENKIRKMQIISYKSSS